MFTGTGSRFFLTVIASILISLTGCRPKYTGDIGSTHVAALSTTPWQDYKSELLPVFNLKPQQALEAAVPDTRTFESAVLDSFRSNLSLRLAPSGVLAEGFGTPTAPDGSPDGTAATQPGVTAAGQGGLQPALPGTAPTLIQDGTVPSAATATAKLKGDAFLKYLAATALYQEVKLLERYVMDATQHEGYEPFIVRLQVTNQPFADQWAYDTYANLAFFCDSVEAEASVTPSQRKFLNEKYNQRKKLKNKAEAIDSEINQKNKELHDSLEELKKLDEKIEKLNRQAPVEGEPDIEALNKDQNQLSEGINSLGNSLKKLQEEKKNNDASIKKYDDQIAELEEPFPTYKYEKRAPIVVPLLVTDQVEAALLAGRDEELRQMSLTLAAAYAGIGAEASLEKIDQIIQKASGRSYRSLFTVGRLSNNMLRIRMAARAVPSAGQDNGFDYQTMARNHFVTVLLLVPRDADKNNEHSRDVYLSTRYEYRWPDTGKIIGPAPNSQGNTTAVNKRLQKLISNGSYGALSSTPLTPKKLQQLAVNAQGSQYDQFIQHARKYVGDPKGTTSSVDGRAPIDATARRLYMDLNVVKLGSNFDSTDFQVRMPEKKHPSLGTGDAYLVDNGAYTEAVINGVSGIDPLKVSATWEGFKPFDNSDKYALASVSSELRGRSQLIVRFPSLIKLKIRKPGESLAVSGTIKLSYPQDAAGNTPDRPANIASYLTQGTPAQAPSLTLDRSATVISPTKAGETAGTVTITFVLSEEGKKLAKDKKLYYLVRFDGVEASLKDPAGKILTATIANKKNVFAVNETGSVTFDLANLVPGSKFTVKVTPPAGGVPVDDLEFTIPSPPK